MMIGSSNDAEAVRTQYTSSNGLNTRITFHDRYSTNKYGYGSWLLSNYDFSEGARVLEVGCGTAGMWVGHDDLITQCGLLMLTDISEGMLSAARENIGERKNTAYALADIQDIPFEDDSFDAVIANSMLYHVPDMECGMREVRRVLKNEGVFYCATYGEHNFTDVLADWFEPEGVSFRPNHNFTLQNGEQILKSAFTNVEARFYEDSLHITNIDDLVEYLRSLVSLKAIAYVPSDRIHEILLRHSCDGTIELPKEYGMFVCS
ncbi:MAG: class I SAM-dependent methyltransferase [Lachnospiraceae bacterium]|nr:class I SAM-dependent methyltransferase [Lachnospiraceae bacterium]